MQIGDILKLDPFKDYVSAYRLRACVGDNSGVSVNSRDCSIIDGYKESVDFMIKHIDNGEAVIDTEVYPFLFCCRHSVELSLKVFIKNMLIIYKIKNDIKTEDDFTLKINDILKKHDIKELRETIDLFYVVDDEIRKTISKIKYFNKCIKDYYFDTDGDVFRYTFKRNQKDVNLKKVRLIDIGVFYTKYKYLMEKLDTLINSFCYWLSQQYYGETYTKKLNRKQIGQISKLLPNKKLWTSNDFSIAKKNICIKFNLSNNDFSKAINIIKNHYLFSLNIGVELKFKDIKENTFKELGKLIQNHKNLDSVKLKEDKHIFDFTEANKYSYFKESFYDEGLKFIAKLPDKEKFALLVFYDMSYRCIDGDYQCEDLDYLYKYWESTPVGDDYILEKITDISINGKIKNAFKKCGQRTYLKWFNKYISKIV